MRFSQTYSNMPSTGNISYSNEKSQELINDRIVRLIGSIFFGAVIPNAAGIIDNLAYSWWQLSFAYLYFAFIAFSIWQLNRYILFYADKRYNWFIYPFQKIIALLSGNIVVTSSVVISLVGFWYVAINEPVNWSVVKITALICIVCVIFITHAYETVFLIKRRQNDLIQNEKLERAKANAELSALKNQIDPHFMFNSLNSLTYLIEKNPEYAKEFTESLAEVYRYILSSKQSDLVILDDEIAFLKRYSSLLKIRYGNALNVKIDVEKSNDYLIPPISIFMALENVAKHNEISDRKPMEMAVKMENDHLIVTNPIHPKTHHNPSTKVGITNLDERSKILMGRSVEKIVNGDTFTLKLPLLKI